MTQIRTINRRERTAHLLHECSFCRTAIMPGQRYVRVAYVEKEEIEPDVWEERFKKMLYHEATEEGDECVWMK